MMYVEVATCPCTLQGYWRKVTIDDLMPFDHEGNLLLPATSMPHELWPMLLTKALLKVAALELVTFHTFLYRDASVRQCILLLKLV